MSSDGETELFSITAVVLQWSRLALFLFVIMQDSALYRSLSDQEEHLSFQLRRRQRRQVRAVTITDLDFADNIALLLQQIEQAQEMERVERATVE